MHQQRGPHESEMLVVPWSVSALAAADEPRTPAATGSHNPLDTVLHRTTVAYGTAIERSPAYAAFVRQVFLDAPCDVGVFLDSGFTGVGPTAMASGRQHIFLPFMGGMDDRVALDLVVQLCQHPGVTATIARIVKSAEPTDEDRANLSAHLDLMLSNEDVSRPKPDPEIYQTAMERLGVLPEETLILEDNEHGIRAARLSGAHLLVVQTPADVTLANVDRRIAEIEAAAP